MSVKHDRRIECSSDMAVDPILSPFCSFSFATSLVSLLLPASYASYVIPARWESSKTQRQHDGDMLREGLWIHDEGSKVVGTDYYWNDISLPRQPGTPYKIV
jgi:hypothetical protein